MRQWRRFTGVFLKRSLSIILALVMVLGIMPLEGFVSYAEEKAVVKNVLVTKTYSAPNELEVMFIELKGENLDKLGNNPVIVRDAIGNPTALTTIVESKSRLYYKIDKPQGVSKLSVEEKDYGIGVEDMPIINSIDPVSRTVSNKDEIIMNGSNFTKENIEINFYNRSGNLENDENLLIIEDKKITKSFLETTAGGPYRVEFKYKKDEFEIEENYIDLFTVFGELNISDDIIMVPNQGPAKTLVKIKGEKLTGDISVFFLNEKEDNSTYTIENRGKKISYKKNEEENNNGDKIIDVFTVEVPNNLKQGRYNVVLTNGVDNETKLEGKITSTKIFPNNIFTVINNSDTVSIIDLKDNYGPVTGTDAIMHGRYIGTLSPNAFALDENSELKINDGKGINPSSNILKITYSPKDENKPIGKYKLMGGNDGIDVKKIEREITIFIGGKATFRDGSTFTDSADKINIRVPSINLRDGENPEKEVTVDVVTTIYYEIEGEEKTLKTIENETWDKKFKFEPISYKPNITFVIPNKIPVDDDYKTTDDLKISIIGDDFIIYSYKDGTETKTKYPIIDLDGEIVLNPNIDDINIKMFDKDGEEIDGTYKYDKATKILITVPKDKMIKSAAVDRKNTLKIINPIKNDETISADDPYKHMGLSAEGEMKFVKVGIQKTPIINSINEDIVTTDGKKGLIIKGENFYPGAKVYIDTEEIKGIKINGTGTEIEFDAPPKPEGYNYQITVQNEEGGLATYQPFIYIKTYTDPEIIDFNPKKGTANTLVTLRGENLVRVNPLVQDLKGIGIWKLIGTRVLLGDKDINDYYMSNGKDVSLQPYETSSDNPIIKIKENDNVLELSDYHNSIILQDEANELYYKIYFDTKSGKFLLTNKEKYDVKNENEYELLIQDGEIVGKKAGEEKVLTVGTQDLKIDGKTLIIKTPYAIETKEGRDVIIGNKVKVINDNELVFQVPPMPREGYYDVTIKNPDIKQDSKTDSDGFYYSYQPEFNPEIKEIKPNKGSEDGGYYIEIKGNRFVETSGGEKPSVSIGTVSVDPNNIEVSPDGKILRVKVPKYPGNLNKETDMDRKVVVVSVVNPDGGSANKEEGFTYITSTSKPKINNLISNKGTAAGGESVTIEGDNFRFFEPYKDLNTNVQWDKGEPYNDLNKNEKWDDLRYWLSLELEIKYDELNKNREENIQPILPKVYFGDKEVKIKDFTANTIEVETPKGTKGPVEVYLVNNDQGTSNKIIYTYEASNPKINTIIADVGRKQGKDKVEILGEGFHESEVTVIENADNTKEENLQIVQFGDPEDVNVSNRDISIDEPQNSGRIRNRRSTVKVGNLTVAYDATSDNRKLNFTLEEEIGDNKVIYELKDVNYDDSEVFLPINILKDKNGKAYSGGYEYVRVMLEKIPGANITNRLRVDRGFSPETTLVNQGDKTIISLRTPSYYTIGNVPVTVINPDGGDATTTYQYKNPDSNPKITNIKRADQEPQLIDNGAKRLLTVNIKSKSKITIEGKDFRDVESIYVGHILKINSKDILLNDLDKLEFKMPEVNDNDYNYALKYPHKVVVVNDDGGTASSDATQPPIYIQFTKGESNPVIESITPDKGPAIGGTTVIIKGNDFRWTMKDSFPDEKLAIFFGENRVPEENIEFKDYKTINVTTPKSDVHGKVDVKVENPDGELAIMRDAFTYISQPIIEKINPSKIFANDQETEVIITGKMFITKEDKRFNKDAEVIIGGKIINKKDVKKDMKVNGEGINGVDSEGKNTHIAVIDGVEAMSVQVEDSTTIKAKFTETLDLANTHIIIINPDGGISSPYDKFKYEIPVPTKPLVLEAVPGYESTVKLIWSDSDAEVLNRADRYEIYGKKVGDRQYTFIGDTRNAEFLVKDLEPNTSYTFMVRAMNKYGSALEFAEATVRTFSKSEDGKLKDKEEQMDKEKEKLAKEGKEEVINGALIKTIGSKQIPIAVAPYVIDLSLSKYKNNNKTTIAIPLSVVQSLNRKITITDRNFSFTFLPRDLYTREVGQIPAKDINDAHVLITLEKLSGARADGINSSIPRTQRKASEIYELSYGLQAGRNTKSIYRMLRPGTLTMNYNKNNYPLANSNKLFTGKYEVSKDKFNQIGQKNTINIQDPGIYMLLSNR